MEFFEKAPAEHYAFDDLAGLFPPPARSTTRTWSLYKPGIGDQHVPYEAYGSISLVIAKGDLVNDHP